MFNSLLQFINVRSTLTAALSASLALSLMCSLSLSQGHADEPIAETAEATNPLQAGDAAPRFTVRTVDNEVFDFNPATLERPAVIITFRGGWCPFCNMHLSELKDVVPDIQAHDVDVLFLSGDRPEQLYESLERETQDDIDGLGYEIMSDADAQAAIAFGIAFRASQSTIDRRQSKGQDIDDSSMLRHGVLPVPAVYAIGQDGMIKFAFVEANYKVRLPSDELLAVVKEIVQ